MRRAARALYDETAGLPIVSPHGHVDPALLSENRPFPEPTALLITPDHYVLRMLQSQGVPLDALGVRRADGSGGEADPRAVWKRFCALYHVFAGTPTRIWMDYVLAEVFGVDVVPDAASADRVYDHVAERLQSPEYRPRALFDRFGIEVLATTDAATDDLRHHAALRDERLAGGWAGDVRPTFRPDALIQIARPGWAGTLAEAERLAGFPIGSYDAFVRALEDRRRFFQALGAVATDHGAESPRTERLPDDEAARLFDRALEGRATPEDETDFTAHMLMEMARMSTEDGLVMQLHAGSLRNHNGPLEAEYGADKGADIPVQAEWTRNLRPLLNAYGTDAGAPGRPPFRLIAFTLDESTYARELAPLAGHYPALVLGPAWWFHDSLEGMRRYREQTTETAGIYNTAGFNDDTRAFCSIPARHDLARRVDANWLGGLVARHQVTMDEARRMARALAYELPRGTYRLDGGGEAGLAALASTNGHAADGHAVTDGQAR